MTKNRMAATENNRRMAGLKILALPFCGDSQKYHSQTLRMGEKYLHEHVDIIILRHQYNKGKKIYYE
jgi:hypothetical protein